MRSIRVSSHVILVRPEPRLRRVAPGVQMLLTIDSPDMQDPWLVSRPSVLAVRPGTGTASPAEIDPRFKLFQALFALIEGDRPAPAALVASKPAETSFGVVSDVDDFTRP